MHSNYSESQSEFGTPMELPRCGGWVLKRRITSSDSHDIMGCYPLFFCKDWAKLSCDLEDIEEDTTANLVSLALVTDPFGEYDETCLRRCFRDVVIPFKEHFVVDLHRPPDTMVSAHHRYYSRKALKKLSVEECLEPLQFIDEWIALYGNLINRHNLDGIKAFSRESFARQLAIPGTVMLRVMHQGVTVGAQIWFVQGEVGYSHLTALNETGYALRASYALYWFAIEYFSGKVRWLDLGAGAGAKNDGRDGLSEFKRGWSDETRTVYFCGRILAPKKYAEIVNAKGIAATDYFPAYRKGEFG